VRTKSIQEGQRRKKQMKDVETRPDGFINSLAAITPKTMVIPCKLVALISCGETVNEKKHGAPAENHQEEAKNFVQNMISTRRTGEGWFLSMAA
jgi:hypothetical protein